MYLQNLCFWQETQNSSLKLVRGLWVVRGRSVSDEKQRRVEKWFLTRNKLLWNFIKVFYRISVSDKKHKTSLKMVRGLWVVRGLKNYCTQQLKLRENFHHLLLLLLGISVSYICQTKYLLFVSPIYLLHLYCTYINSLPLWPINIHDTCFSFSVTLLELEKRRITQVVHWNWKREASVMYIDRPQWKRNYVGAVQVQQIDWRDK